MTTSNLSGPHDLLLAWLSARPEPSLSTTTLTLNCRRLAESTGMLAQVQGAEKLSQSHWRYQLFDPLYRLGHVEQIAQDRWMLIPPVAIRTVVNENRSVLRLYGARSTSLWQQFHTVFQTCGATLSQTGQDNGPTRWQIEMATDDVLAALEQALSVEVYPDRSDELLASLPTLAQAIAHLEPCQFPQHGQWEQFCPASQLHWQPIQLRQPLPEGLYRPREQSNYACFIFERHPDGKGTTTVLLDQPELNYVAR